MQREESKISEEYPLHYLVWKNNTVALRGSLLPDNVNLQHLEQLDPRGRTPLMLAVTLEHVDCVILLLESGANVNVENKDGWTGMLTFDPVFVQIVCCQLSSFLFSCSGSCINW